MRENIFLLIVAVLLARVLLSKEYKIRSNRVDWEQDILLIPF
jgi:hypothetical protein